MKLRISRPRVNSVRDAGRDALESPTVVQQSTHDVAHVGPIRTCVGCRKRHPKCDLLRVVARLGENSERVEFVADPQGTAAGRGAYLHPTGECLDAAIKARAFIRALRQGGRSCEMLGFETLREEIARLDR